MPSEKTLIEKGEKILYIAPNGEALVETEHHGRPGKRQYVAIEKSGFRTDYPLRYEDGRVVYDHPEWFTKGFRAKVSKILNGITA